MVFLPLKKSNDLAEKFKQSFVCNAQSLTNIFNQFNQLKNAFDCYVTKPIIVIVFTIFQLLVKKNQ